MKLDEGRRKISLLFSSTMEKIPETFKRESYMMDVLSIFLRLSAVLNLAVQEKL